MTPTRSRRRPAAVAHLTGRIRSHLAAYELTLIDHPAGAIVAPGCIGTPGASVTVTIRAESVSLATGRPGTVSIRSALAGTVAGIAAIDGPFASVAVTLSGGETLYATITWLAVDLLGLAPGVPVHAMAKAVQITVAPPAGKA